MWAGQGEARWIDDGDANTRFFHISTVIHKRHNFFTISCILNPDNNRIRTKQEIGLAFQNFFENYFLQPRHSIRKTFKILLHRKSQESLMQD